MAASVSVENDCMCGCENNCSCVTLDRFRQIAMANMDPSLFWGLTSSEDVFVVQPAARPVPLRCTPGPQGYEDCLFSVDGTYHCTGGTHGTWDPTGPEPDFTAPDIAYNSDGTYVLPTGEVGTWVHADGLVGLDTHTDVTCTVSADGVSYTCSDGSSGTVGSTAGMSPTDTGATCTYLPDGSYLCSDGTFGTWSAPVAASGSNPSVNPNIQCVNQNDGTFICDDGTVGYSYQAGGSTPATTAPNSTCTYLPDGTFNCPDGSYGAWGWSGPSGWTGTNGGTSQGSTGSPFTEVGPYAGNTYNADNTYVDSGGTFGVWFPLFATDIPTDPTTTYNSNGTFVDSNGNTQIYIPIIITDPVGAAAPAPDTPSQADTCKFYIDGTFVCVNGHVGTWDTATIAAPEPGYPYIIDACNFFSEKDDNGLITGYYFCENGSTGTHYPPVHSAQNEDGEIVPIPESGPVLTNPTSGFGIYCNFDASNNWACNDGTTGTFDPDDPNSPIPTDGCIFYIDGTYVCPDGTSGLWERDVIELLNIIDNLAPDHGWAQWVDTGFNFTNPALGLCYYYSDGVYACVGGKGGYYINEEIAGTCYYLPDGRFSCDDGSSGYWTPGTATGTPESSKIECHYLQPSTTNGLFDAEFICEDGTNGFMQDTNAADNEPHEEPTYLREQIGENVCTHYPDEGGWRCSPGTLDNPTDDSDKCFFHDDGSVTCPDGSTSEWGGSTSDDPTGETTVYLPIIETAAEDIYDSTVDTTVYLPIIETGDSGDLGDVFDYGIEQSELPDGVGGPT